LFISLNLFPLPSGLAVVFAEDIKGIVKEKGQPKSWKELCPLYDSLNPNQL
jgi:iron transport multicopper oxidase